MGRDIIPDDEEIRPSYWNIKKQEAKNREQSLSNYDAGHQVVKSNLKPRYELIWVCKRMRLTA